MSSLILYAAAQAHVDDLRRQAARRPGNLTRSDEETPMPDETLTIRTAHAEDAAALRRLAALDSAAPPAGRALIALRDGAPVAAISLETGTAIADPFQPTADAVRMLRLRRDQLVRQGGGLTPAWRLGRRLAIGLPRR
jgi:hypothetical protein